MAYMRIHCGDCGMVKEVHKYVPDDTEVRYCPLCGMMEQINQREGQRSLIGNS